MYSQSLESSQSLNEPTKLPSLLPLHPKTGPLPSQQHSQTQLQQHPLPGQPPLPSSAPTPYHPQHQPQQPFLQFHQLNQQPPSSSPSAQDLQNLRADEVRVTQATTFSATLRRGPWSLEEDKKLMESISMFGPSNWVRISQTLGSRTPKQCRERYHQNLKPSLNRSPITPEEGQLIEELVAKHGKRWAEIARHLNCRSDNAIKNWWNGGANRRRRASTQAILDVQHYHQPPPQVQSASNNTNDYYPQLKAASSFNTDMFSNGTSGFQTPGMIGPQQQQQQQQSSPPIVDHPHLHQPPQLAPPHQPPQQPYMPHTTNASRSGSTTQEIHQQHQGIKRLLEDQHHPLRRHSTQMIFTPVAGSTSPYSAPYSRSGEDSSRNSSISIDYNLHSNSTSRRSSLAHELFPNPAKRKNSQSSSTYLSPSFPSHRSSAVGVPSTLTPLTAAYPPQSLSEVSESSAPSQQPQPIFKPDFNFTKRQDGMKLPPPSSIQPNVEFNGNSNTPGYNNRTDNDGNFSHQSSSNSSNDPTMVDGGEVKVENDQETKSVVFNSSDDEEPKTVMNISNLLS